MIQTKLTETDVSSKSIDDQSQEHKTKKNWRFFGYIPHINLKFDSKSPKNSPHNSPQHSPHNSPKQSIRNSSRSSSYNSPKHSITDSSRSSPQNSPKHSITDSPKHSITDSPKHSINDSPKNSIKDSPRNSTKDSTQNAITDSPRNSIKDSPDNSFKNSSQNSPHNSINDHPQLSFNSHWQNLEYKDPDQSYSLTFCYNSLDHNQYKIFTIERPDTVTDINNTLIKCIGRQYDCERYSSYKLVATEGYIGTAIYCDNNKFYIQKNEIVDSHEKYIVYSKECLKDYDPIYIKCLSLFYTVSQFIEIYFQIRKQVSCQINLI